MATIDLIILGMLKDKAMSAYDIQKLVEYRKISDWVKISTPSIYKKVIGLEEKGLITGTVSKEGKMPEKVIYTLTPSGDKAFHRLMKEVASSPVHLFLDFNAVIVNLDHLDAENKKRCLESIMSGIKDMRKALEENIAQKKDLEGIPSTGIAVLEQQLTIAKAMETWLDLLMV